MLIGLRGRCKTKPIKFLDENTGGKLLDRSWKLFFLIWHQKQKNKQLGLYQTKKLLHWKGNHQQNEKTTFRMGENIYNQCNRQGINFQNIQTAHAVQYQKKNKPMGRRSK